MIQVLKFLLDCVIQLTGKLFTINFGEVNFGVLLCILYVFFPIILLIIGFAKGEALTLFAKEYRDEEKRRSKK